MRSHLSEPEREFRISRDCEFPVLFPCGQRHLHSEYLLVLTPRIKDVALPSLPLRGPRPVGVCVRSPSIGCDELQPASEHHEDPAQVSTQIHGEAACCCGSRVANMSTPACGSVTTRTPTALLTHSFLPPRTNHAPPLTQFDQLAHQPPDRREPKAAQGIRPQCQGTRHARGE